MIRVASLRPPNPGSDRIHDVEIAAPRRSYEIVSDAGSLGILPEPWKTPGGSEIDRLVISAFPTAPWTALRAAHRLHRLDNDSSLSQSESKVRFTTLDTLTTRRPPRQSSLRSDG